MEEFVSIQDSDSFRYLESADYEYFIPNTPPNDGGSTIRDYKIVSQQRAIWPLSGKQDDSEELGTRHRAAIGLEEVSDDYTTEETGKSALRFVRNYTRELSSSEFAAVLSEQLVAEDR